MSEFANGLLIQDALDDSTRYRLESKGAAVCTQQGEVKCISASGYPAHFPDGAIRL